MSILDCCWYYIIYYSHYIYLPEQSQTWTGESVLILMGPWSVYGSMSWAALRTAQTWKISWKRCMFSAGVCLGGYIYIYTPENAGSEKHDMFMPLQLRGKYIYIHISVSHLFWRNPVDLGDSQHCWSTHLRMCLHMPTMCHKDGLTWAITAVFT